MATNITPLIPFEGQMTNTMRKKNKVFKTKTPDLSNGKLVKVEGASGNAHKFVKNKTK